MPRYSELAVSADTQQAENLPGHKRFDKYDLPSWCAHPLKPPSSEPIMLLFPGEQTQYPGMVASCVEYPVLREMIELATEAFEFDVFRAMQECGPDDSVDRTDRSQMLAYVANCVAFELLKQDQPEVAQRPRAVAGFSVGEYAALVAAGVMSYDQGLIIVKARAEAMQSWVEGEDFASLAVYGPEEETLEDLCNQARLCEDGRQPSQQVYISHHWGKQGYACSGRRPAVAELQRLLAEKSSGVSYVQVLEKHKDAGHTPLATCIADHIAEAIDSIPLNPPHCEIYFNHGYRVPAGEDPSVFSPYLLQQISTPLRWSAVIQGSLQRGIRRFYECGPGHSLKELMIFNEYSSLKENIRPYELTTNVKV